MARRRIRYGRSRVSGWFVASAVLAGVVLAVHGRHGATAASTVTAAAHGSNEALANSMAASGYGWTGQQATCLDELWTEESAGTWSPTVTDPLSGAYGIPQALPGSKMASAGPDWQTSAATQIKWGLGYIAGRYGTPCGAWTFEKYRGRDRPCGRPPAQIPACAANALGSCLGSGRETARLGRDASRGLAAATGPPSGSCASSPDGRAGCVAVATGA